MNNTKKDYDVIIIGGGPAGLSAGIYTSRARLRSLMVEKGAIGGQIINAEMVENFPGFPEGVNGFDLTQMMHQQATRFGLETTITEVNGVELGDAQKIVKTADGDYSSRAVIITGGSERQKLGITGEAEYTGKGVSYCATCDAAFFQDKPIAIVGGGDSAITEALHLSRFASRVVLIHRRNQLRATRILQEKVLANPKIELLWETVVEEIIGDPFVKQLRVRHLNNGQTSMLDVSGLFVSIGFKPSTDIFKGIVNLDATGAIITDDMMATSLPGVFAAGDIRSHSIRQVVSATGDGATAAVAAEKYILG
jgi:thioredoxin reductase (NADPH)